MPVDVLSIMEENWIESEDAISCVLNFATLLMPCTCFCSLLLGLESVPSGESQSVAGGDEDALDEYQELSTREEQDIESMMVTCEYAISNAEAFAEKLFKELQVLDGVSKASSLSIFKGDICLMT